MKQTLSERVNELWSIVDFALIDSKATENQIDWIRGSFEEISKEVRKNANME
jgi:hypothetical protein